MKWQCRGQRLEIECRTKFICFIHCFGIVSNEIDHIHILFFSLLFVSWLLSCAHILLLCLCVDITCGHQNALLTFIKNSARCERARREIVVKKQLITNYKLTLNSICETKKRRNPNRTNTYISAKYMAIYMCIMTTKFKWFIKQLKFRRVHLCECVFVWCLLFDFWRIFTKL